MAVKPLITLGPLLRSPSESLVLKVGSLNPQEHHLGICLKCRFSGSTPRPTESEIPGLGPSHLCLLGILMQVHVRDSLAYSTMTE